MTRYKKKSALLAVVGESMHYLQQLSSRCNPSCTVCGGEWVGWPGQPRSKVLRTMRPRCGKEAAEDRRRLCSVMGHFLSHFRNTRAIESTWAAESRKLAFKFWLPC